MLFILLSSLFVHLARRPRRVKNVLVGGSHGAPRSLKRHRMKRSVLIVCRFYTCPLEISNYNSQYHAAFKERSVFLFEPSGSKAATERIPN